MGSRAKSDKPGQSGDSPESDKRAKAERRPVPYNVARGAIVWLPGMRYINGKKLVRHLPMQIFDHPVLIYDKPTPTMANVFLITSFKEGESLVGKFQSHSEFRGRQIPLIPSPPHPDNGVQLTLMSGRVWPRESFVSLSLFTIPIKVLREESSGPWALSPASLGSLDKIIATLPTTRI
ncbi:uncharacterized protein B0H64DRAFT_403519 [Chaetomium fimeti]|uniref:Uncharacterized protein n=1 Tax=Chaetomium fimeti TaxID=1854472 RepID=A0AAE0LQ32_9PEZI|nr:hypothetical protein B0H64DRAFT_403519 [Chaetomium fimeti]